MPHAPQNQPASFQAISLAVIVACAAAALLNEPAAGQQPAPAKVQTPGGDRLTPSELEELLGSIALYPDALLANVLAASVYPDEVAEAAKFVADGGKSDQIDGKSWEDPVKAVAKIPDAIKMMGEYSDWTIALGQAYLLQAKDVMDTVQTLRKKAQDNGALASTPQQKVVVEQQTIYIKSADPEIIYVPSYSPSVVYLPPSNDAVVAGVIGFGLGVTAGLIIANNIDCHWNSGCVGWGYHGGGGYHNDVDIDINRGDINVGGDVNIGNKTVNSERTNNRVGNSNRIGNEGNAWAPDRSKKLASSKPDELGRFGRGSSASERPPLPSGRNQSGDPKRPGSASGARPSQQPGAGARPGGRPESGRAADRPASQPAAKSKAPTSRPPAASAPRQKPATPPRQPGAFEGGKNTKADSQRGASSRSQSSAKSAGSRPSGGGGGGKSGGGGGKGGGGRR